MLFTASTVKDTLPNIQRFVTGNLAGGVDHLFVFLDSGEPEVRAWLDQHPHVTCVRTDKSWWHGERPAELNVRQRINANLVKALLSGFDWADWVFHVDADEIVQIDRAVLATVPRETRGVLDRPSNGAYFHGHVDGKSGVRPGLDLWLTLHHGVDAERNELPSFKD